VGAYRSDLTRSFFYGKIPPSYRRIFAVVESAQRAGMAKVRPGATGGEVDGATRGVISAAGHGRTFVHSTGHGVGIDIHEPPWIRPKSSDVLATNMILTVEPGIYLTGRFGVRIEDTLRVTPEGHERLTTP
jgi:Xaa-Pro aminopeptidase